MTEEITGVIIAGGKSRRLGENKALLKLQDKTIIEIVRDNLKAVIPGQLLIANRRELYEHLEIPVYEDIYPGKGPLAGIHSALVNSKTDKIFVISCDMPLVTTDFIRFITEIRFGKPALVPLARGKLQTMCAIYKKECIDFAERILCDDETGNYSVHRLLDEVNPEVFDAENKYNGYTENLFFNINTRDDYRQLMK